MNFGIEIGTQRPFEQQPAETCALGSLHGGTAGFLPADAQFAVRGDAPGHLKTPLLGGERTIFRGIGCQFVKCHAQADRALRVELDPGARDAHVAAFIAIGRCFIGKQHLKRNP